MLLHFHDLKYMDGYLWPPAPKQWIKDKSEDTPSLKTNSKSPSKLGHFILHPIDFQGLWGGDFRFFLGPKVQVAEISGRYCRVVRTKSIEEIEDPVGDGGSWRGKRLMLVLFFYYKVGRVTIVIFYVFAEMLLFFCFKSSIKLV